MILSIKRNHGHPPASQEFTKKMVDSSSRAVDSRPGHLSFFWRAIFLTTWPTVATVRYSIKQGGKLIGGIKLPLNFTSESIDATIGFSTKFSIFYIFGPTHEN